MAQVPSVYGTIVATLKSIFTPSRTVVPTSSTITTIEGTIIPKQSIPASGYAQTISTDTVVPSRNAAPTGVPIATNELAWLRATSSDAALRNGPEAVQLAEHGCAVTSRRDPMLLDTLAVAYAEAGRFPEAVSAAQKALALARTTGDEATVVRAENLLGLFQSGRPFHQNPTPSP